MSDPGAAPENLLTEWATLLLGSLRQAGVQDVIVSPGSRSTPLVLAAARCPGLRLHDIIDERSAAFFALGQARVTGRPSLLLCTSGTAGAHYLPAVIEAGASGTPLLVLTADRPFELQGCAAPQTIDQIKLYGGHERAYFDLGMPDAGAGALRALRRIAAQAVLTTRWPAPGAVHLNARARKPLEPRRAESAGALALAAEVRALLDSPLPTARAPRLTIGEDALDDLIALIGQARRGLIMCGPAALGQAASRGDLAALAERTGFPLLCEATSQLRFSGPAAATPRCDLFEGLLRDPRFRADARPDLILQLGAPPTSGAWESYLAAHPACPRIVVAPQGWSDPQSSAVQLLLCEPGEAARLLSRRLPEGPRCDPGWQRLWRRAGALARRVTATELARPETTEGALVAAAVEGAGAAAPRSLLMLGNSLPIREVDALCPGEGADLLVLCQRGANGIDGLISGAAGAASTGRPVTLLLGDISFLHDVSGLAAARGLGAPLAVVVLNNQGGRIFEQLPVGDAPAELLAHFTTPHALDLGHAARLYGHPFLRADSPAALRQALAEAHGRAGCTVIEAPAPPASAAEARRRLDEALAEALSEPWNQEPGDLP